MRAQEFVGVSGRPIQPERGYYSIWIRRPGDERWTPITKYPNQSDAEEIRAGLEKRGLEAIIREGEQLDELTFKGSQCTVDCSGHRAGYEWWFRKRRNPNSWSPSFNKGAALAAAGK